MAASVMMKPDRMVIRAAERVMVIFFISRLLL